MRKGRVLDLRLRQRWARCGAPPRKQCNGSTIDVCRRRISLSRSRDLSR